ncbi:MAG: hypothetical protein AUJ71_00020 [Candidatus Omnitrophica bacterium CG1_02_49_16]|nr:MAG: hypothetical protein AUJ71_00020 [Candidatus Omnitrophica bacterium CG1_02_49_16]
MDDFLLTKFQIIKSLEAVSFIWVAIIVTLIVVVAGYVRYCQLRYKILFQIDMFNGNIFLRTRLFLMNFAKGRL